MVKQGPLLEKEEKHSGRSKTAESTTCTVGTKTEQPVMRAKIILSWVCAATASGLGAAVVSEDEDVTGSRLVPV